VPLDPEAMIGSIAVMPDLSFKLLGISDFVLHRAFGSRGLEPFRKWRKFWGLEFDIDVLVVARGLCRKILLFPLHGIRGGSFRNHDDDVFLNGVGGSGKHVAVLPQNTVVFYKCFIHEGLTDRDGPFFEKINLIPHPLHPYFGLLNLDVYVQCMLNSLCIHQSASLRSCKGEEIDDLAVDGWDAEFMRSWIEVKDVVKGDHGELDGGDCGEACEENEEFDTVFVFR